MAKWNADKIQPKLNQLSRGLATSIDTVTPRTLDKQQDLLSQVIYPDMEHAVMLTGIYFLGSGKTTLQSIPSPSTTQVTVSPPALQQVWNLKKGKKSGYISWDCWRETTHNTVEVGDTEEAAGGSLSVSHQIQAVLHRRVGLGEEILGINLDLKLVCQAASHRSPQIGNSPLYKASSSCV